MPALNEFDVLLVIAQLAVAFAGFASLSTAFGDRGRPQETRVDAGRLTNMLVVSLCTAILALAPTIPALFRFSDAVVWRSCAAAAIVTMLLFAPGVVMRTRRMKLYAGFSPATNSINLGLAAIAALAFAACASGIPGLRLSAVYVTALVTMLAICALVFFRVIASLLRPHAPE